MIKITTRMIFCVSNALFAILIGREVLATELAIAERLGDMGYEFAESAASLTAYDDDCIVARVYKDSFYSRQAILLVCDAGVNVIEDNRYAGENIQFRVLDLNADNRKDLVVVEAFEVGGAESTWSVRAYISDLPFRQVLDSITASIPQVEDLTGDGVVEIVTTTNKYGYDQIFTFVPTIYTLQGGTYQIVNPVCAH